MGSGREEKGRGKFDFCMCMPTTSPGTFLDSIRSLTRDYSKGLEYGPQAMKHVVQTNKCVGRMLKRCKETERCARQTR